MQVSELDMMGLSGLLEFLSYEINKPDPEAREMAAAILRGVVENINLYPIDAEDAVAVQALAISLLKAAPEYLDDPDRMISLLGSITLLVQAAGGSLEALTGKLMTENSFFENCTPINIQ